MSYLPRMSKTYKEPQEEPKEEPEPTRSYTVQPASSLLNEKSHNPQITLKHYKYLPHPPPVLPGPSVAEEATENELFREASRVRRSSNTINDIVKPIHMITFNSETSLHEIKENQTKDEDKDVPKRIHSRRPVKGSKTSSGRKKNSKSSVKKRESSGKIKPLGDKISIGNDLSKSLSPERGERQSRDLSDESEISNAGELNSLRREHSLHHLHMAPRVQNSVTAPSTTTSLVVENKKTEVKGKDNMNRGVQCTIFGNTDKVFIIPPVISCLLKALAFLLHEVNREEVNSNTGERKRLMNQIQLILGDLCNQKFDNEYTFSTTYSDSKRIEKILADLQKYIKEVYGDKDEHSNRTEKMKKIYVDLKKKEMELIYLNDKLTEKDTLQVNDFEVTDSDYKFADVTLQNKRLESEQLLAQVKFSNMELTKYQKSLAEADWDIKTCQEELASLKKAFFNKSKTDVKGNIPVRIPNEVLATKTKSRESEIFRKRP